MMEEIEIANLGYGDRIVRIFAFKLQAQQSCEIDISFWLEKNDKIKLSSSE